MLLTKIAKDLISSTRFMEKALDDLLFRSLNMSYLWAKLIRTISHNPRLTNYDILRAETENGVLTF